MAAKLTSFGVRGFRALKDLRIKKLGDINLFVGKNNSGKTTILEALRIYLSVDPRIRVFNLLASREEFTSSRRTRGSGLDAAAGDGSATLSFEALFSGRPYLDSGPEVRFGPLSDVQNGGGLSIRFSWLSRQEPIDELQSAQYQVADADDGTIDLIPGYVVGLNGKDRIGPLDRMGRVAMRRRLALDLDPDVVYLPSAGMTMQEIGMTWDTIALTDDEDEVVRALKIIAPELEKIVLIQSPQQPNQRMLMAKLSTFLGPVPFKSLGEGTVHLLSVVLAMIQARGGTALLDEVENGVHHSVQKDMWSTIIDLSKRLNVQVFATTHSRDCVNGFALAASTSHYLSKKVFRLDYGDDGVTVTDFTTEEVLIAGDEGIEIR